jgi:fused signal recognition particle receptor
VLKLFAKISQGLAKTRTGLVDGIAHIIRGRRIDDSVLDELEELLILSDVGVETAETIVENLRQRARREGSVSEEDVINILKQDLVALFDLVDDQSAKAKVPRPLVISVVGVNGTGKTTTIAKLAHLLHSDGKKVLLAAADTFRAAASDQLSVWAERVGVDVVQTLPGADPAAVAYDALKAAVARNVDVLLIDTAGRLHTKANLMAELSKIHKVLTKIIPEAPHEVLLVLDAATGQNGLAQAKQFAQAVGVTGLVLTKLDGTAKGGIVFSIVRELKLPVRYIGVGEKLEDLAPFDPHDFVDALFQ